LIKYLLREWKMKGQKTKTFRVYFKVIIVQFAWRILAAVGGGGGKGIG
jgi:hypothetical protein